MKIINEYYSGKLKLLLKCVHVISYLTLVLISNDLKILRWYIDWLYATHEYFKGHTGDMLTMGRDSIMNTRISM